MVDLGDGFESFMADGKEACCAGWVEDDRRGTLVGCCTSWETTGGGRGRSDAGDGIFDGRGSSEAGDGILDGARIDG